MQPAVERISKNEYKQIRSLQKIIPDMGITVFIADDDRAYKVNTTGIRATETIYKFNKWLRSQEKLL